ncbi:hypothetical protein Pla123a_01910 [Posidoniimonas polymericola]|uniref:SLA1 homology domain-containing protein n=1 Tax=Posidoniimonas polymericola TaxID=2528002 RepID=A0A5C5ZDG5_9BACT|nr:SHD1 domain-containing protein [Posidoniimonas polymericola]TWT85384.1 hypothetical protein Pla123a_01910 [Posidoniimonas polymericola]
MLAAHATAADQTLLVAPDDAPRYQLGGVRVEPGRFGRDEIVIGYTRTREGDVGVSLAGRSKEGAISIMGISPRRDEVSGEFRLNQMFGGRGGALDYEFYLVSSASWAGENFGQCLVSNTVSIGSPGGSVRTRQWTAEERAAYEKHQLGKEPPASLPSGYQAVERGTTLVPGMPIKVGYYGDWKDAEYINDVNEVLVNFRFHDERLLNQKTRTGWVAVDPEVLKQTRQNLSQFAPSVSVLPGGRVPLEEGMAPLPKGTELLVGTPLYYARGNEWREAYVLNADSSGVKVRYEGLSSAFDRQNDWSEYAIRKETLTRLSEPGAAEEFAANIPSERKSSSDAFPSGESVRAGVARAAAKRFKEYKVSIDVPERAQFVPDDLTIEEGTPLAGCWARKWNPITAISENDDGTVNVHWDDYSDAWDCSMSRDQLIIQDKTVRKLRRKYGEKSGPASSGRVSEVVSASELTKTLRTWADASGQHKIEARFVSRTADKVTIKTDAGREISLAIDKLSEVDQELLSKVKPAAAVANPFE